MLRDRWKAPWPLFSVDWSAAGVSSNGAKLHPRAVSRASDVMPRRDLLLRDLAAIFIRLQSVVAAGAARVSAPDAKKKGTNHWFQKTGD